MKIKSQRKTNKVNTVRLGVNKSSWVKFKGNLSKLEQLAEYYDVRNFTCSCVVIYKV